MSKLSQECIAVTNYIIEKIRCYNSDKMQLSEQVLLYTKKIQKLLYLCEVEYMKRNNGEVLFVDEYKVWPSGPAIDGIYSEYMSFSDYGLFPRKDLQTIELSDDVKNVIDYVLDRIMTVDTCDLINACGTDDITCSYVISKESIYLYYKNKDIITDIEELSLKK